MGSDERVKTLLFTYLFQVNDWFGVQQQNACHQQQSPEGYLSKCATFRSQIQGFLREDTNLLDQL